MGGIIVLLCWASILLLLGIVKGWPSYGGFILASGLGFGGLGLADDVLSIRRKHSTGLTGVQKLLLGSLLSIGLFVFFKDQILVPQQIPFSASQIALPWIGGLFLTWLLLVASTNSANLTDGLDGLASGVSILVLGGLLGWIPVAQHPSCKLVLGRCRIVRPRRDYWRPGIGQRRSFPTTDPRRSLCA